MRLYYSSIPNIFAFKTLDKSGFLIFGVPNTKYLTFDPLNGNALIYVNAQYLKIRFVEWLKDHEGCGPCGVFVFSNIILGIDQKLVQCFRSIQLYGLRCAIPSQPFKSKLKKCYVLKYGRQ